jgi:hypothetical protein
MAVFGVVLHHIHLRFQVNGFGYVKELLGLAARHRLGQL